MSRQETCEGDGESVLGKMTEETLKVLMLLLTL